MIHYPKHPTGCASRSVAIFLLGITSAISSAAEIRNIALTYQGSAATGSAGTSKEFDYILSSTPPQSAANKITFTSSFRFFSRYTQGTPAGVAQLFRVKTDYQIDFEVRDPNQVGYAVKVSRHLKGVTSLTWSGHSSGSSSTATMTLGTGFFFSGATSLTPLADSSVLNRSARESNPTPADQEHLFEASVVEGTHAGDKFFSFRIDEPATQITHTFQNYNYGKSVFEFGLERNLLGGFDASSNDHGDTITVEVIYNPVCRIVRTSASEAAIEFSGILQESDNLLSWKDVDPQPLSPHTISLGSGSKWFRSRSIEGL